MTSTAPQPRRTLTPAEQQAYWDQGYLFPFDLFTAEEVAALRAELETIERDYLDADLPLPLNTYKRVNAHVVMPLAARVAQDPRILDLVEGILGPDLLVWSAEFFIKEPGTKHVVGMHQDLTYWGLGETPDQLTAWLALSPSTHDSGCMEFVAGSHKNPILPHNDTFSDDNLLSRGQEIAVDVPADERTLIELQPGQMSLHHGLTIHGSGPNVSDDRRIGLAIRYLNPKAQQEVADRDFAMLVRGKDEVSNFTHIPAPTGLFSPDALDLYEEIRRTQAKALAQGAEAKVDMYQSA